MNYSELYQQSSKLHPGSPIEQISELLHKADNIHAFDRTRLFHTVAQQTRTSVDSIELLYASEPLATPGAAAEMKWTDFETHDQVIRALVSVEGEDVHPKIATMLRHAAQFLIEQERLGEEAVNESIEEISKGPSPDDARRESLLELLSAITELVRRA